jgi:hypothetical protein
MRTLLYTIAIIFLFAGCTDRPPDKLVDEDTYKRMFIEFAIVDQFDSTLLNNRTHEQLRQLIYEHYEISEEQFRISHEYYESDINGQIARVDSINAMLHRERERITEAETEYRNTQRISADSLRQQLLNR